MPISRRRFLSSTAKVALAAPFFHIAKANAADGPRRLVVLFTPDGVHHPDWVPQGSGENFGFAPGSVLEPLTPMKDKLLVMQGCDLTTSGTHEHGAANVLTGGGTIDHVGGGQSIDRFIGSELRAGTRFNQLNFGVASNFQAGADKNIFYSDGGVAQPPEDNPAEMFRLLFPDEAGPSTVTDWRQRRLALNKSELTELRNRVGTELATRLDVHAAALDALQQQLIPQTAPPTEGCGAPALQAYGVEGQNYPPTHHMNANFPTVAKNQRDLLVAALACDATRVAGLQYSHSVSPTVFDWAGDATTTISESHHALSHTGEGDFDTQTLKYRLTKRWESEEVLAFLQQLDTTPDPLGDGSLLDSTLVFWCSELGGSQRHDSYDMPFVLAGAGIRAGQFLELPDVKHNRLLVSLAAFMGVSIDSYGDPNGGTGVISEVLS